MYSTLFSNIFLLRPRTLTHKLDLNSIKLNPAHLPGPSTSEVMTLWRYTNTTIIISIPMIYVKRHSDRHAHTKVPLL